MSLQVWLPLNRDPNMTPEITSYRVEANVTRTEDEDGWYKITDLTHGSGGRWGIYYDFAVKPNTTYTLYVYSKSTTGTKASIGVQSFAVVTWPAVRDTNTASDEKLTTYSWTTGPSDSIARVYLALVTTSTKDNDYVFYKEPRIYEAPQNQGIANLVVTNNGVLINDEGKLGKCYYFDGGAHYLSFVKSDLIKNTQPWSVSAWVKLINGKGYYPLFWAGASTPNASGVGGVSLHGGYLNRLECSDGTHTLDTTIGTALSYDEWYHITLTYDGLNITKYINGVLNASKEWTYGFGNQSQFQVGGFWGPDLYGYINDFRIYDHALSEREIKELARGLVLHYPLNNNGFGGDNLSTLSNTSKVEIPASSTSNYNYFWIVVTGNLIVGETYTFSAEVEVSDNIESCTVYNYNVNPTTSGPITYNFPADGKRHSWTFTATATGLIAYAGSAGKTIGHSAVYKNIKLEKGDKATPYVPRKSESSYSNAVYDISGFQNNGTITGALSTSIDTPRYNVATYFDGTSYIVTDYYSTLGTGNFTISAWIKLELNSSKTYQPIIINKGTGAASVGCGIYFNHNQNKFLWSTGDGSTATEIWTAKTFTDLYDKWIHIVMVRNTSDTKKGYFYINGVREELASIPAIRDVSNTIYPMVVGAIGPHNYTTYQYTGDISDLRLYATALSADDIKELYEMGVSA